MKQASKVRNPMNQKVWQTSSKEGSDASTKADSEGGSKAAVRSAGRQAALEVSS